VTNNAGGIIRVTGLNGVAIAADSSNQFVSNAPGYDVNTGGFSLGSAVSKLMGHLAEIFQKTRTGRAFDLETITVKKMVAFNSSASRI
jgi:hypothetical protein